MKRRRKMRIFNNLIIFIIKKYSHHDKKRVMI